MVLFSSCATYRPPVPPPRYVDCEHELTDCYAHQRRMQKEHKKEMMKAFFGTLFVVSFMHWTR
jgi:hypothetical protein